MAEPNLAVIANDGRILFEYFLGDEIVVESFVGENINLMFGEDRIGHSVILFREGFVVRLAELQLSLLEDLHYPFLEVSLPSDKQYFFPTFPLITQILR
jgi:hypothetical protein